MRLATARRDEIDQILPIVATVTDKGAGGRQAVEQRGRGGLVRRLSGAQQKPDRQAALIHDGMDLGAQSATRTANGVIRAPFLPPAACWWARMMELSINCRDCGDCAASVSNICSQTPAFAQRL